MKDEDKTKEQLIDELIELRQRISELEALETEHKQAEDLLRIQREFGVALNSTSDPAEALNRILEIIIQQIEGFDAGGVYLVSRLTGGLDLAAHKGLPPQFVESVSHYDIDSPQARLVVAGKPIYQRRSEFPPAIREDLQREDLRTLAIIPVEWEGQVVAVLNLASHTHDEIPTSARDALEAIATQIGGGIARVKAEAGLWKSEQKLRNLVEQLDEGIALVDGQGAITEWNPSLERITGLTRAEVLGRPIWDVQFEIWLDEQKNLTARQASRARMLDLLRTGQAPWLNQLLEIEIQRPDGARQIIQATVFPIRMEGEVMAGCIARDITERVQAEEEIKQRNQELEVLNEVSLAITSTLNLQEMLTVITERTTRLLNASAASVALYDQNNGDLRFAAASGTGADFVLGKRLAVGQGIVGWVVQHGQPVLVLETSQDPRFFDGFDKESGFTTHSILCAPLQTKGRTIGAIEVMNKKDGSFNQEDLRLLTSLAAVAATAIENARLFDAEVHRRYEAETLREATAALASTLDLNQVLDSILTHLDQVVPYDSVHIFLQEEGRLHAVTVRGLPDPEPTTGLKHLADDTLYQEIQHTDRPLILADVQADPRFQNQGGTDHIHGWMAVPLMVRGDIIGYLTLESKRIAAYGEAEAITAQAFANEAAIAIQNARLFEQVRTGRERLQALSRRLVEVQEAERRHIARELHDEVGQVLTGLKLTLDMSTRLPTGQIGASLGEAQEMVNELMAQVRELSLDLRPTMLDDLGLLPALLWHFERYTAQTDVHVSFRYSGVEGRFSPEVETAAYRIVQEALTNVARHASVSEATVRLWVDQDTLGVQIEDQGIGFDPEVVLVANASSGLSGMQERAALLGGHLTIESAPGVGTRLTAEFPPDDLVDMKR